MGKDKTSHMTRVLHATAVTLAVSMMSLMTLVPSVALADIDAGGVHIRGYRPDEIISTDVDITGGDITNVGPMLNEKVMSVVMTLLPILAVASVVVLIYNAVRNMFLPDEDPHEARKAGRKPKRPMGQVLKDIFMMYFWILFAWVIVELIIYGVTHILAITEDTLTPGASQSAVTQQSSPQQVASPAGDAQQGQVTAEATPVGTGATPVGTATTTPTDATATQAGAGATVAPLADGTAGAVG